MQSDGYTSITDQHRSSIRQFLYVYSTSTPITIECDSAVRSDGNLLITINSWSNYTVIPFTATENLVLLGLIEPYLTLVISQHQKISDKMSFVG
ncbi:hypothetical protein AVEN_60883-1 [Araneus ventricosus]|uniref:Uncharacterized protein n=1 Tax=Araneus ventricosus TaxID=182803 RepID=A0A4Y2WFL3_ARAVE|nr:hypothetical protein AVEN_14457-1 [Araneus ventricosus]GBO36257.1 hypothetical protein AVEN_60883-1 [Araneus ventricosus]